MTSLSILFSIMVGIVDGLRGEEVLIKCRYQPCEGLAIVPIWSLERRIV